VIGSRRWWCAGLAAGLALLVAPRAEANVGVPMLMVLWPVAVVAFVPVVAVEAVVARRVIGGGWGAAWKVSLVANLATTIAGVPVTWFVMLLVQLVVSLIGAGLELGPEWSWIGTPFVLAWLPPHVERAAWWVGMAGAGLSVPLFFASVWIERRVGRRVLAGAAPEAVRRWSWWANGWSYAGLVLFWIGVGVKWYLERPAG
jgi:hypothetical protein